MMHAVGKEVACYDLIKPWFTGTWYHVLELLNLLVVLKSRLQLGSTKITSEKDSCLCWVYVLDTNLFVNGPLVGLLSI